MKRVNLILIKATFYLLALQILNVSVDVDYIISKDNFFVSEEYEFDDIDSYTELLSEEIADDENYTSENDDDSGSSQNSGVQKYNTGPLFFQTNVKAFSIPNITESTFLFQFDRSKTCKGYLQVLGLPPIV